MPPPSPLPSVLNQLWLLQTEVSAVRERYQRQVGDVNNLLRETVEMQDATQTFIPLMIINEHSNRSEGSTTQITRERTQRQADIAAENLDKAAHDFEAVCSNTYKSIISEPLTGCFEFWPRPARRQYRKLLFDTYRAVPKVFGILRWMGESDDPKVRADKLCDLVRDGELPPKFEQLMDWLTNWLVRFKDTLATCILALRDLHRQINEALNSAVPIETTNPASDTLASDSAPGGTIGKRPSGGSHSTAEDYVEPPVWNADKGELFFRGQLCKRLDRRARNQRRILDEFHDLGWPSRIEDPLPPPAKLADTLRDLVRNLNAIAFRGDGSGKGIIWEPRPPQDPPADLPEISR